MDLKILEITGKVAGIGGLSLGVFLILFREVIRKAIFPTLAPEMAYRLIRQFMYLTFAIAALGLLAWVYISRTHSGTLGVTVTGPESNLSIKAAETASRSFGFRTRMYIDKTPHFLLRKANFVRSHYEGRSTSPPLHLLPMLLSPHEPFFVFPGPDMTLHYTYSSANGVLTVSPDMPYFDLLARGGPVVGLKYPVTMGPFVWDFPQLAVKVANNTDSTVVFTKADIDVATSKIDVKPVLVIHEDEWNVGNVNFVDEGWGPVVHPIVDFAVESEFRCTTGPSYGMDNHLALNDFSDNTNLPIMAAVPKSLRHQRWACVSGTIQFSSSDGVTQRVKFRSRASLKKPPPALPMPPSKIYDVFLRAGKSSYVQEVSLSQVLCAGQADNFRLRIGTDKSAHFELTLRLTTQPPIHVDPTHVTLDVFVPRSNATSIAPQAQTGRPQAGSCAPPHDR